MSLILSGCAPTSGVGRSTVVPGASTKRVTASTKTIAQYPVDYTALASANTRSSTGIVTWSFILWSDNNGVAIIGSNAAGSPVWEWDYSHSNSAGWTMVRTSSGGSLFIDANNHATIHRGNAFDETAIQALSRDVPGGPAGTGGNGSTKPGTGPKTASVGRHTMNTTSDFWLGAGTLILGGVGATACIVSGVCEALAVIGVVGTMVLGVAQMAAATYDHLHEPTPPSGPTGVTLTPPQAPPNLVPDTPQPPGAYHFVCPQVVYEETLPDGSTFETVIAQPCYWY
ncbi:MAG TPA: hypothetical protein VGX96_09580 [Candidatus Elarobacter sp.]|nr:hypothetical protein [Candidatus Elarobacter sp.]